MSKKIDLTGKRFGRLVVVKETEHRKNGQVIWECKCDCGNICLIDGNIRNKKHPTRSCGCLNTENAKLNLIPKMHKKQQEVYAENVWVESTHLKNLTAKKPITNTSGVKGVGKKGDKWRAYIQFQGKSIHLGYYSKLEDAAKARKEAEEKYFTPILEKYGRLKEVEESKEEEIEKATSGLQS